KRGTNESHHTILYTPPAAGGFRQGGLSAPPRRAHNRGNSDVAPFEDATHETVAHDGLAGGGGRAWPGRAGAAPRPPPVPTPHAPPGRLGKVLRGRRDRPRHGPAGGGLARTARARKGGAPVAAAKVAAPQARRGPRRRRRGQRLLPLPARRARRPRRQGLRGG